MSSSLNPGDTTVTLPVDVHRRPWFRRYPVAAFLVALILAFVSSPFEEQFHDGDLVVDSDNPQSLTANANYQDTWHGAIGAQYRASDKWQFSAGYAYDSSAVSDANRTLSAPMGQAYRIGLGAQWQVSPKMNLGAAYEFLWGGDMPVTQDSVYRGRVSGGFNDTWFSFFTLNATWKF